MRMKKTIVWLSLYLSWGCFLYFQPSFCEAAAVYQVTEQELQRLENNLNKLEQINRQQQKKSIQLQEQLNISLAELTQAENKSRLLQKQLGELQSQSKAQEKLLENVNQSFKKYAQEEKQKINELKRQKNILLIGLSSALLYGILHK